MIQIFDGKFIPDANGRYVLHTDHLSAIAELEGLNKTLLQQLKTVTLAACCVADSIERDEPTGQHIENMMAVLRGESIAAKVGEGK